MTSEFAVAAHALVFLQHKNTTVSSEALAENVCTHPSLVRRVMSKLKKAGLVATREGTDGGYTLAIAGEEITLGAVLQALDEALIAPRWRSGSVDKECLVASGMAGVLDGVYANLNTLCRVRLDEISVAQIEQQLFSKSSREQTGK